MTSDEYKVFVLKKFFTPEFKIQKMRNILDQKLYLTSTGVWFTYESIAEQVIRIFKKAFENNITLEWYLSS